MMNYFTIASLVLLNILLYSTYCVCDKSYLRKCADLDCTEKISLGRTTQRYISREKGILSFAADSVVTIYGKDDGENNDILVVEIDGHRGRAPKKFIREERIFVSDEKLVDLPIKENELKSGTGHSQNEATNDVPSENDSLPKEEKVVTSTSSQSTIPGNDKSSISLQDEDSSSNIAEPEIQSTVTAEAENDIVLKFEQDSTSGGIAEVDQTEVNHDVNLAAETDVNGGNEENEDGDDDEYGDEEDEKEETENEEEPIAQAKENADPHSNMEANVDNTIQEKDETLTESGQVPGYLNDNSQIPNNIETEMSPESITGAQDTEASFIKQETNAEILPDANRMELPQNEEKVGNNLGESNQASNIEQSLEENIDPSVRQEAEESIQHVDSSALPDSDIYSEVSINNIPASDGIMETESSKMNEFQSTSGIPTDSVLTNTVEDSQITRDVNQEATTLSPTLQSNFEIVDGTTIYDTDYSQAYTTDVYNMDMTESNLESSQPFSQRFETTTIPTPTVDLNPTINTVRPNIDIMKPGLLRLGPNLASNLKEKDSLNEKVSEKEEDDSLIKEEKSDLNGMQEDVLAASHSITSEDVTPFPYEENIDAGSSSDASIVGNSDVDALNPENVEDSFATPKEESILSLEGNELNPAYLEENKELNPVFENLDSSKNDDGLVSSFISSAMNLIKSDSVETEGQNEVTDENKVNEEHTLNDESLTASGDDFVSSSNNITSEEGILDNNVEVVQYTDEAPKPEEILEAEHSATDENLINEYNFIDPEITEPPITRDRPIKRKNIESSENQNISDDETDNGIFSSVSSLLFNSTSFLFSEGLFLGFELVLFPTSPSEFRVWFIIVVSTTICVIYAIHCIATKMSQEAPLLQLLSDFDRKNRILHQENILFKSRSSDSNGIIPGQHIIERNDDEMAKFMEELNNTKAQYSEQESNLNERVKQLEQELEESTSSAMEMHKMLDELLSSQKEDHNFKASVDYLQSMLDNQRETVESLTSNLSMETTMNEQLRKDLKSAVGRATKLDDQVNQLTKSLKEVSEHNDSNLAKQKEEGKVAISLKDEIESLLVGKNFAEKSAEKLKIDNKKLKETLNKLEQKLGLNEMQLEVSKECLKKQQLMGRDGSKKLDQLFNGVQLKSQVMHFEKELKSLNVKLEDSESSKETLTSELKSQSENYEQLESKLTLALKDSEESRADLEVLKKYFEEKEAELRKEILSQEDLKMATQGSVEEVASRLQNYQAELESYKSVNESLKNEIEEQIESHKLVLKEEEKKSHENWLQARQAERRQEELRQENKQLRQRVTMIGRGPQMQDGIAKMDPKYHASNGSISSPGSDGIPHSPPPFHPDMPPLPPHLSFHPPDMHPGRMMPGLPPLPFMMGHGPPPPPPFMENMGPHPNERTAPAGRIASPPYDRAYSPESDNSHYSDHYSPKEIRNMARYSPSGATRPRYDGRGDSRRPNSNRMSNRRDQPSPSKDVNHRPPDGYRFVRSPEYYFDDDEPYRKSQNAGSTKTSTPLGSSDR